MIRDIFQPFYIFQPGLNRKIQTQQQKALTYRYSLMVPLLNDDEEHPNQQDFEFEFEGKSMETETRG